MSAKRNFQRLFSLPDYNDSECQGEDRTYHYGEKELESKDFPNALSALSADSFTDEEPGDKLEIGLTLHLDTEEETSIQVDLYR